MLARDPDVRQEQRRVRKDARRLRRRSRRSIAWRWRRAAFLLTLLAVAAFTTVIRVVSAVELPAVDEQVIAQTSYLCAGDVANECGPENAMATFRAEEDRQIIPYDEFPQVLIDAVVAIEDRKYFTHYGVDPNGIARAAYQSVRGRSLSQGGSTITQQYIKNAFLTDERTFTRKAREAILAVKLEQQIDKREILERYLNTIYFGRGAYGAQAASRAYFDKDVADIDLAEAAYLAGLIRRPSTADASKFPAEASRRRQTVVDAMVEEGYTTPELAAAAAERPWEEPFYVPLTDRVGLGPVVGAEYGTEYFVDYVRQELQDNYGSGVYTTGLRIHTTLDPTLQRNAFEVIENTLPDAEDPAAALIALDERGRIVAMVGGSDYEQSEVNLTLGTAGGGSGRQPGSAFKPIALAEAMKQGISPRSKYFAPRSITIPKANAGEDWEVKGGTSQTGVYDLVDATRTSSNTVYAQLVMEVGAENVAQLAGRMGVTASVPEVPAIVLGVGEVSVLDMASAYSTLANRGEHIEPSALVRIEDPDGVEVWKSRGEYEQILPADIADSVTDVLRGVIESGTGKRAAFGRDAAGKTGTTQNYNDAWFVGYTCNLTVAVWIGHVGAPGEAPKFLRDVQGVSRVTGGSLPAQIWGEFMAKATEGSTDDCRLTSTPSYPGQVLRPDLTSTSAPVVDLDAVVFGRDGLPVQGVADENGIIVPVAVDETGALLFGDDGNAIPISTVPGQIFKQAPTTVAPEITVVGDAATTTTVGPTPSSPTSVATPGTSEVPATTVVSPTTASPPATTAAPTTTSAPGTTNPPTTAQPQATTPAVPTTAAAG